LYEWACCIYNSNCCEHFHKLTLHNEETFETATEINEDQKRM